MAYPNLKAELARNGVSVIEVAELVGVSNKTVYNWLNGSSVPDIKQAMEIWANFFPSLELTYLFAD